VHRQDLPLETAGIGEVAVEYRQEQGRGRDRGVLAQVQRNAALSAPAGRTHLAHQLGVQQPAQRAGDRLRGAEHPPHRFHRKHAGIRDFAGNAGQRETDARKRGGEGPGDAAVGDQDHGGWRGN